MFAGLRKPTELIVLVVTLLSYGCPVQAIVQAYGLDERTVASWRDRAGAHCEQVHHAVVEQGGLELLHVQADEIRVKGRGRIMWMALAMMVSTRLWVAGVVSPTRDTSLADRLLKQVRACALSRCALLVLTDGWARALGKPTRYGASLQAGSRGVIFYEECSRNVEGAGDLLKGIELHLVVRIFPEAADR